MRGLSQSNLSYDFEAFNASGQVWNGSAFVTYAIADYASYRIAATKLGNANDAGVEAWFSASDVTGAVYWQMRERGATLALSYIAYIGPDVTETAIANAATAATNSASIKSKTDLIGTIRSLIRW